MSNQLKPEQETKILTKFQKGVLAVITVLAVAGCIAAQVLMK